MGQFFSKIFGKAKDSANQQIRGTTEQTWCFELNTDTGSKGEDMYKRALSPLNFGAMQNGNTICLRGQVDGTEMLTGCTENCDKQYTLGFEKGEFVDRYLSSEMLAAGVSDASDVPVVDDTDWEDIPAFFLFPELSPQIPERWLASKSTVNKANEGEMPHCPLQKRFAYNYKLQPDLSYCSNKLCSSSRDAIQHVLQTSSQATSTDSTYEGQYGWLPLSNQFMQGEGNFCEASQNGFHNVSEIFSGCKDLKVLVPC